MSLSELSRRERKKEETRRRIFEVAVDLFRTRGFEATTVDEITERADVARGTFFNYFPRKEAVLAYLSESRLLLAEDEANAILGAPGSSREKIIGLFLNAGTAYEEDRELSRFVFAEWMKRGFAPAHEAEHRWQKLLLDILAEGRSRGELREDVPGMRADGILSGVYISTLYQWLFCPESCAESIPDLHAELAARLGVVLDGLSVPAGVRS